MPFPMRVDPFVVTASALQDGLQSRISSARIWRGCGTGIFRRKRYFGVFGRMRAWFVLRSAALLLLATTIWMLLTKSSARRSATKSTTCSWKQRPRSEARIVKGRCQFRMLAHAAVATRLVGKPLAHAQLADMLTAQRDRFNEENFVPDGLDWPSGPDHLCSALCGCVLMQHSAACEATQSESAAHYPLA
jgi:hypothetical protein